MRVLFLAHSFPRYAGDIPGAFLLRLAVALRGEGVQVSVVAPSAPGLAGHELLEGIPVHRFRYAPRSLERLAYTGNMAADVRSSWVARGTMASLVAANTAAAIRGRRIGTPDLVHAHWWFPGGLAASLGRRRSMPLVTTMHGSDVRLARTSAPARALLRFVVRRSRAVTTVSSWLAREVQAIAPDAKPIVEPMPVDVAMFSPGGDRSADRLLFVGRLSEQKGVAHLIDALSLSRLRPSLDVVGDGPLREELESRARAAGADHRVRFHGSLPAQALAPLYRGAAAVVVPSIEEGLGLVAVEALLCEAPVIATASGGLTDVVEHEATGILVPPADPRALARGIDRMVGDRALATSLARAGRAMVLDRFSPEGAARRYAALYRRVHG